MRTLFAKQDFSSPRATSWPVEPGASSTRLTLLPAATWVHLGGTRNRHIGPCVTGVVALPFMAMLCFDIRGLEVRAESVDGTLDAADPVWEADDVRPAADGVRLQGRLSAAGHGRFYFTGELSGTTVTECRRCLVEVEVPVTEAVTLLFAESGLDEAEEDDVVPIPPGARELDLRPALREEWLLAAPAFALCREDCQGLCPACGIDRNTGACSCAPATDARWAGLRDVRAPGS